MRKRAKGVPPCYYTPVQRRMLRAVRKSYLTAWLAGDEVAITLAQTALREILPGLVRKRPKLPRLGKKSLAALVDTSEFVA